MVAGARGAVLPRELRAGGPASTSGGVKETVQANRRPERTEGQSKHHFIITLYIKNLCCYKYVSVKGRKVNVCKYHFNIILCRYMKLKSSHTDGVLSNIF